jgi:hypothetical protein
MAQKRNRRNKVEDRWTKNRRLPDGTSERVPSARHGKGLRWLARYVDDRGEEHSNSFSRKPDAQKWLDVQTAALVSGTHVAPRDAQLTVEEWCDLWIEGYKVNRASTGEKRAPTSDGSSTSLVPSRCLQSAHHR